MYDISYGEIILKLVLSVILGGAIGFEREVGNRPAGLRTHILVSIGAALIMLISKHGFGEASDPGRLAAQVVSGIGFLGAGTILRTGNTVQGLTTAASLWVCAGIGLAAGNGFYFGAIVTTILVLVSLVILARVENFIYTKTKLVFKIVSLERPGLVGDIGTLFGQNNTVIRRINLNSLEETEDDNRIQIELIVDIKSDIKTDELVDLMYNIEGIQKISVD